MPVAGTLSSFISRPGLEQIGLHTIYQPGWLKNLLLTIQSRRESRHVCIVMSHSERKSCSRPLLLQFGCKTWTKVWMMGICVCERRTNGCSHSWVCYGGSETSFIFPLGNHALNAWALSSASKLLSQRHMESKQWSPSAKSVKRTLSLGFLPTVCIEAIEKMRRNNCCVRFCYLLLQHNFICLN